MAEFKLVSSNVVPLTKQLAEKHRDMAGSPTERELDPSRVWYLSKKIEVGLFVPPSWAVVTVDGKEYRMNGQHSSHALCDTGSFPDGLQVHLDHYEADDIHGLVTLFRQFDARKSSRSTVDIAGAYKGVVDGLESICPKIALRIAKGIAWHLKQIVGAPAPTSDEVGSLLMVDTHKDFILWAASLSWDKARECEKPHVVAAMYGMFEQQPDGARAFWDTLIRQVHHADEEHPSTALGALLMDAMKGQGSFESERPKPAFIYEACVQAWNSFRAEKPSKMARLLKADPKSKGYSEIAA